MIDAPTTRETADHAELKRLAEAAKALWLDEGWFDYRTLSLRFELDSEDAAFIAVANPARVLALLSEIAALRGERDDVCARLQVVVHDHAADTQRLRQAERQRDKLRAALERLASSEAFETPRVIDGPLAPEMRARMSYARQALVNQEADKL